MPGLSANRINTLDSFRFFAILAVMLFHYYARWAPPLYACNFYPYSGTAGYFSYGYLGVHFFFIISGFVIAYTLHATPGFFSFWKKRFIRLFPAMAICSLITFVFFCLADRNYLFPDSYSGLNLLYSFTLIKPTLLNHITHLQGNYINGSYWSLWPEIQFYGLVSLIYFLKPKSFYTNFTLVALGIFIVHKLLLNLQGSNVLGIPSTAQFNNSYIYWVRDIFNLPYFVPWFLMGALLHQLYSKQHSKLTWPALLMALILLMQDAGNWKVMAITCLMLLVFTLLIYRPALLHFLSHRSLTNVGIASYSLYLIHENLGVFLIHQYGSCLGPLAVLFPILLMALFIAFSLLLYKYVERPLNKWIKNS